MFVPVTSILPHQPSGMTYSPAPILLLFPLYNLLFNLVAHPVRNGSQSDPFELIECRAIQTQRRFAKVDLVRILARHLYQDAPSRSGIDLWIGDRVGVLGELDRVPCAALPVIELDSHTTGRSR